MKLKYAALINIAGIIFSSFSPAFADTQSDKLREREKRLTEQAVVLSDKEINLEDKELQLNRKKAELDELAKKMHSEKIEFSVREIELDDTRAKLNRDSEMIAEQNRDFLNDKAEFEDYRALVIKQAEEADRKMFDADEALKIAQTREEKNMKRERELTEKQNDIIEELSQLSMEKAEILMLQKKTDESIKKLTDLEEREKNLKAAQEIFKGEQEKLEKQKADFAKVREDAEKKIAEAKELKALAEKKMKEADAIIKENDTLALVIDQLSKDLMIKEAELLKLKQPDIRNAVEITTPSGIIDWSKGSVRAKGMGVVPPNKTQAQGEVLARRAAIADLQRNLLETIQGVQIDAKTKVVDHMASDVVNTAVIGTIRGVEIVEEDFDGEKYTVAGQIHQETLSNVMSKILAEMKIPNRPKEVSVKTGMFTGLIIDARHLAGLQERKAMRIVDEKGIAVYGIEFADRNIQAKKGLCEYYNNIVLTDDEVRVGDNPLLVKAQRLSNSNEDIVIPTEAADEIRSNAIDFRKECKVIIVKS